MTQSELIDAPPATFAFSKPCSLITAAGSSAIRRASRTASETSTCPSSFASPHLVTLSLLAGLLFAFWVVVESVVVVSEGLAVVVVVTVVIVVVVVSGVVVLVVVVVVGTVVVVLGVVAVVVVVVVVVDFVVVVFVGTVLP